MRRVQPKRTQASGKSTGSSRQRKALTVEERRQQNLKAPISRLPPELVFLVMSLVKDDGVHTAMGRRGSAPRNWIRVTQVYHLWRSIALSAPNLWCDVRISKRDNQWALEMMRRSGQSPLEAKVYFEAIPRGRTRSSKSVSDALRTLEQNLSRCRKLSLLRVPCSALQDFLPNGRGTSTSQLHTLRIVHNLPYQIPAQVFTLCDKVLRSDSLRSLSVTFCDIDWNSRFLRNLTHLKFRGPLAALKRPPFITLLNLISEMPALELLDVDDYFDPTNTFLAKPIILTFLKDLRLKLPMNEAASILSYLSFPPTTNIRLMIMSEAFFAGSSSAFRAILAFFSSFLSLAPTPSSSSSSSSSTQNVGANIPRCLRLYNLDYYEYQIQAFRETLSQDELLANAHRPSLDCTFLWDLDDDETDAFVFPLIDALPLDHIVSLLIIGDFNFTPHTWAQKFGTLPALRSIALCDDGPISLFEGLVYGIAALKTGSPIASSPPFPALTSVLVHKVGQYQPFWFLAVTDFIKHLRLRHKVGSPILRLTFVQCLPLPPSQIKSLKRICAQVVENNDDISLYQAAGDSESELDDDDDVAVSYN